MSDLSKAPEQLCPGVHAIIAVSPRLQPEVAQALLRQTADALGPQVGHITAVADPKSIGASAYNQGARAALGIKSSELVSANGHALVSQVSDDSPSHLLFCQAGTQAGAHAVSIMLRVLDADNQIGVVGPVTDGPAGQQQVAAPGVHYRTPNGFALFSDYVAMLHRASHRPAPRVDSFFMLTTAAAWSNVGGFDTRFDPAFFEDDDFCATLADQLNLLPAIAYGAWVGWSDPQPWSPSFPPAEQAHEQSRQRYEKKWAALSRLTLAGSLPPERGIPIRRLAQ